MAASACISTHAGLEQTRTCTTTVPASRGRPRTGKNAGKPRRRRRAGSLSVHRGCDASELHEPHAHTRQPARAAVDAREATVGKETHLAKGLQSAEEGSLRK
jgi:hypothetical protein